MLHGTLNAVVKQVKPEQELTALSSYGSYVVNPDGSLTVTSVEAQFELRTGALVRKFLFQIPFS